MDWEVPGWAGLGWVARVEKGLEGPGWAVQGQGELDWGVPDWAVRDSEVQATAVLG